MADSVATKIKRLLPHVKTFDDLKAIELATRERRKKLVEDFRERERQAAMADAADRIATGRVAVTLDPKKIAISGSGLIPGEPIYLRQIHRGRKWIGCYCSRQPDSTPKNWFFISAHDLTYIKDFDPSPDAATDAKLARQGAAAMARIFGSVPATNS